MTVKSCPICNSVSLFTFFLRCNVPTNENLIFENQDDALDTPRGDLTSVICKDCNFIFNQTFNFSLMNYGDNYENSQNSSVFFQNHISNLVNDLIKKSNIRDSRILEIGCGDGYFLKQLVQDNSWNNTGIGYDPSYVESKTNLENIRFEKLFFDDSCKEESDFIISRHVIEHIPEPIPFLKNIRKISKPHTRIFFETPTVEWILKNHVFWDFTYEHCSFFTKNSLTTAFQIAGFKVKSVKPVFNNQYLWLEAVPSNSQIITKNPLLLKSAEIFQSSVKNKKEELTSKFKKLMKHGNIALWGAAGKSVCLANTIDPNRELIECLIDLNPKKWGKFIPGTGHEIINFTEIEKRKIKTAIIMNPNYYDEIKKLIIEQNLDIILINSE